MTIYKVTFPAVAFVGAGNIDEAKQNGLDRANYDYFTSWGKEDIVSIEITTEHKICPQCKFYVIKLNDEKCCHCT